MEHFERLNKHFKSNYKVYLLVTIIIAFLFSLLHFDLKITVGGDDSWYITAAVNFLKGKAFPQWHGSFYPIFLSFFIWIAGVQIPLFKIISVLFVLLQLFILFKAFQKEIYPLILIFTLLHLAVSPHITYYASTTYSEPLFFFLQALFFLSFYKLLDKLDNQLTLKEI